MHGARAADGQLARLAQFRHRFTKGIEFHGDVARIAQVGELTKNIGIVDFAGARMMTAGNVSDVHKANEADVFLELGDEVASGNLLVEKIVEELDVRIANGADNLKAFGRSCKKILGILLGVDVFDEQLDVVFAGNFSATLERFDAVRAHFNRRETNDFVSGLHNKASAFQLVHGGDEFAKRFEKSFASAGICQGQPDTAGGVNFDGEFAFFAASIGKILFLPILEFLDKFDRMVARFGDLLQTLRKRKIAKDSPKHNGERERHAVGFRCRRNG